MIDGRAAGGGVATSPLDSSVEPLPERQGIRSLVACDHCGFAAWIGARGDEVDAWCEACQRPAVLATPPDPGARCANCTESLSVMAPRFEELYGGLQNLLAVLDAWLGRPERLRPLVPERPALLTDLNPPPLLPWDPPGLRHALESLIAGAFSTARERFERLGGTTLDGEAQLRAALGLAVTCQRLGDAASAERAFDQVIGIDPGHSTAYLDRGALRAQRGDFVGARADFARAGVSFEARWNRAAAILLESITSSLALPDAESIRAARAEAGAPSRFWSDPTVGRLLFMRLAERASSSAALGRAAGAAASLLRAAEAEVEFTGFTDRAMVLLGYIGAGLESDVIRVARPLALGMIDELLAEPFARGAAGRDMAEALSRAGAAARETAPARARDAIGPWADRPELRRYRIPCVRCGRGSIGVEQVVEADPEPGA